MLTRIFDTKLTHDLHELVVQDEKLHAEAGAVAVPLLPMPLPRQQSTASQSHRACQGDHGACNVHADLRVMQWPPLFHVIIDGYDIMEMCVFFQKGKPWPLHYRKVCVGCFPCRITRLVIEPILATPSLWCGHAASATTTRTVS